MFLFIVTAQYFELVLQISKLPIFLSALYPTLKADKMLWDFKVFMNRNPQHNLICLSRIEYSRFSQVFLYTYVSTFLHSVEHFYIAGLDGETLEAGYETLL